jgi:hypothetical protein
MKLWQCSACHEAREDCGLQCQLITADDVKPNSCIELRPVDQSVWDAIEKCDLVIIEPNPPITLWESCLPICVAFALGLFTWAFVFSFPDNLAWTTQTYVYFAGILFCLVWFSLWSRQMKVETEPQ